MEEEIGKHVKLLERLHREDYVKKDESHRELRDQIRKISEFALGGPLVYEFLADKTLLAEELKSIVGTHESKDVRADVLSLFCDLCEFDENLDESARTKCLKLVNKLMDVDVPREIVNSILGQHDTDDYSELYGDCLRFLNDLCELYPSAGPEHLVERTQLVEILVQLSSVSIGGKAATAVDVAEASAAGELLSMILDTSQSARDKVAHSRELLDKLLRGIANWKSHEPGFAEEEEWREVLHSCLRRAIEDIRGGKENFRESEGIQLCIKMLSARMEKKSSTAQAGDSTVDGTSLALQLLIAALDKDVASCGTFIESGGIPFVFPIWMDQQRSTKRARTDQEGDSELPLGNAKLAFEVIALMMLWLDPRTDAQLFQRMRNKFAKEEGKLARLLGHYLLYLKLVTNRLEELENEEERDDEDEDEEAARIREEADLFSHGLRELQLVDIILCRFMRKDDDGFAARVKADLAQATGLAEQDVVDEVLRVVADMAESCVVLEGEDVDEQKTKEMKRKLVQIAMFE